MGTLLGFKFHHLRGKKEVINKYIKALLWTLSLGSIMITSLRYAKYNSLEVDDTTYEDHAFFFITAKMCWILSIIWIIYACHNGDGGIINRFLSNSKWIPMSRMCLTVYFIHVLLQASTYVLKQPMYFNLPALVKITSNSYKSLILN